MAVENTWHIQDKVIYTRFYGDVLRSDLELINTEVPRMLEAGSSEGMYWLIDCEEMGKPITDITALRESVAFAKHPNLRWTILFGYRNNRILTFMSSILAQIFGIRFRQHETRHEALAFLRELDETLVPHKT